MIYIYQKDEMGLKVNKANKEETRPAVVTEYNVIVGAVVLKSQILQSYLHE
jgi:hypothetical protein